MTGDTFQDAFTLTGFNNESSKLDEIFSVFEKEILDGFETEFLKSKQLTPEHIANRELLRKVMKSQKFVNIATEWWHFNAFSIKEVRKKYPILK